MDYFKISTHIKDLLSGEENTSLIGFIDIMNKINDNRNNYAYCLVMFNKLSIELKYVLELLEFNNNLTIRQYFYNTDVSKKEINDFIHLNKYCTQDTLDHILHKCYVTNMALLGTFFKFKMITDGNEDCIKNNDFRTINLSGIDFNGNINYHKELLKWIMEV